MAVIPPLTRKRSEIETKIHAALEEERAKQKTASHYIRLSSIGKCERALWALRNGIEEERPPDGRTLMTFGIGHHLEEAVIEWLIAADYEVECEDADGDQWRVTMGNMGVGHLDGMIRWGKPHKDDWRLLEIKTAKAKKFDELVELGSYAEWNPGYLDQIQAYMGASQGTAGVRSLTDCLVVVVCKDDSRLYCEMIRFDVERYAELKRKASVALGDEMPPRPKAANGRYSKFCKWCDVGGWCYSALAGVQFDE